MKSDTVKPMPPSTAIEAIIGQSQPLGIGAKRSLTVSHENRKMPRNLPSSKPQMMARLDVKQEDAGVGKGEEGHYQVVDNGV